MRTLDKNEINLISGAKCSLYNIINGAPQNPIDSLDLEIEIKNITRCIEFCCYFHDPSNNIIARYYFSDGKPLVTIPETMKPGLIIPGIIIECANKTEFQF